MADPRTADMIRVRDRIERQTPLYKALMKAREGGGLVNACPFGCDDDALDDRGYCVHLIGFTEDKKTVERVVREGDRVGVSGRARDTVRKGDKLLRITTTYRVYRENPDAVVVEPAPAATDDDLDDDELERATRPAGIPGVRPITHNGKTLE